jgi:hypothetical protein
MKEKIARKINLLKYALRASRGFQQPLRATLRRALTLYREKRFLPEEAFAIGLLRLDCDPELLRDAAARRYQAQVQRRLNPASWSPLLADKGIFYRFCEVSGIPIPDLYAIYFRRTPGYCPKGTSLYDPGQWSRFIAMDLPSEFVVKPCGSYRGIGVLGYTRTGQDEFLGSDGVTRTSGQIVDSLRLSREADSFVIQQRLRSHPALSALSQSSNLQTLRITTFIDRAMNCHLLFSHLKLMTRVDVFVDNIGDGLTGGLLNVVCLETGTITKSLLKTRDGTGDRRISHHPVTQRKLAGFAIPCWAEACELVRRAAYAFLPVRSVGWDVGITEEGVKLVEGNIWWDRRLYAGDYLATLLRDLDGSQAAMT